jgi:hypothetical protein
MARSKNTASVALDDELTLTEARELIIRNITVMQPSFLWGPPGLGKSAMMASIATDLDYVLIDLRLSMLGPQDILGIPIPNVESGTVVWSHPDFLPTEEFAATVKGIILFLDEINLAPPAISASCYQLINERRVGQYVLPDNVVCVAAGNRATDGAMVQKLLKPLANRFTHYTVKPDFDSWLTWALEERINTNIVAFLSQYHTKLFSFDPSSPDNAFPTPRSWTFASKLITPRVNENGREIDHLSPLVVQRLVASAVGRGTANEYAVFLSHGQNLPSARDILSGRITTLVGTDGEPITEISAQYQLVTALLTELREWWESNSILSGKEIVMPSGRKFRPREWNSANHEDQWRKMLGIFLTFVMDNFSKELNVLTCRIGFRGYNIARSTPMKTLPAWQEFTRQYGRYLKEDTEK